MNHSKSLLIGAALFSLATVNSVAHAGACTGTVNGVGISSYRSAGSPLQINVIVNLTDANGGSCVAAYISGTDAASNSIAVGWANMASIAKANGLNLQMSYTYQSGGWPVITNLGL
ncbi:MAG: hypothetical protein ACYC7I_04735 [Gammaproteobacteria bacterium]